jgi:hypothetical protein
MKIQKYIITDGTGNQHQISASNKTKALEIAMKKLKFAPCKIELKNDEGKEQ